MLRRAMPATATWAGPSSSSAFLSLICLASLFQIAGAAFITFQNCLDPNIINSSPLELQFTPLFFNARFDTLHPSHNLNITIYGNVSGQATQGTYPPPDSPTWSNPNDTFGKIVDVSPTNDKYSTLFQRYEVLTYNAYDAPASRFCESTVNDTCPLVPSFNESRYDPYDLSAFTVAHDFYSSYAFGTFAATIRVQSGDAGAPDLACVSSSITPDLGKTLAGLLTFLPAAALIFVAIATAAAAVYSPWGSSDPFKWTTNYGRDEDLLRLVTPGFGDCLQYIQFIFLTGALSLNYPGYYQPATSQTSWAALQFNESFVSHGNGTQSLMDGIYVTNGTDGMTRMSQLVGMTAVRDVWACMAVWLVVLAAVAVVLCQLAFFLRWLYRQISNTTEQDLRQKNWPLTAGMIVRICYNYFLLPIVAISMFQLVMAARSPTSVVVMAVILLVAIIIFAGWILHVIFSTKPRSLLFDDLPTVLMYGSLYNTYSDGAAPFALIPAILTFMRGVAIGAVQPSGIAQLVVLAICEVILILTLHAFRPFHSPTHMNIYHTFFAAVRLSTVLLMVAFVPSLGVTEGPKGWIGYAILLLHAIVLVFGFFMNAVQTLIEVGARLAGAGGDPQHGAQRGTLISYSWRQLNKRQPDRRTAGRPGSMASDAAILAQDSDAKSINHLGSRSRSLSASSQALLNQHLAESSRLSGYDQLSQAGELNQNPGAETPSSSQFPFTQPSSSGSNQKKPVLGLKTEQPLQDPYYRPPRARRATLDPYTPGARSRQSGTSGDWGSRPFDDWPDTPGGASDSRDAPLRDRETPSPAHFRNVRSNSDPDVMDQGPQTQPDYSTREVDFYYGVRGPALSNQPARKRKTGPADPMGPVSSASSWFQRIVGGKNKDKGKGFEVVRSARAPSNMVAPRRGAEEDGQELQTSPPMTYPPYRDTLDPQTNTGAERDGVPLAEKVNRRMPLDGPWDSASEASDVAEEVPRHVEQQASSPPLLAPIARTASFNMNFPGRGNSYASTRREEVNQPSVPRKSSRRPGSRDMSGRTSPYMSSEMPSASHYEGERPTSMGLVSHRTIGDSTFQSGVGESSAAEFVHGGERTTSME